ncbi:unnamed protein product [Rotaria socialis]|uniref:Transmembrane protein n=1 Tax=Rotaria socialis TaxID=392032 RepID=A0A820S2I8_9BILA|nr:unnamed protein product [Rotaria socialis]CAF3255783.1 unnamed protein product [Rotaria socialis]CAF3306820.1 unnamed protein product [Rotaria socialis]CAF3749779.1 unnamed protein product [Rotaria socialis]CAF4126544.1 unnamed protein product [Rotaria socialis]
MQESSTESNNINELDFDPNNNSFRPCVYFLSSWLDKYKKSKLEFYSVTFGISGISLIALGLCVFIIIYTAYDYYGINKINCSIVNITHTHVKLCEARRCQIFNYCIPYICTIVFVHYDYNNLSYESKLFPFNPNINSSCSYEPSSCTSRLRIQLEQITFLKKLDFNRSKIDQCCLHSLTQQPIICKNHLNSTQYSISILSIIICFLIGLIFISIGIITQLHLNDYLKSSHKHDEDFLDTILNFHFSNGTLGSGIERATPVNYDILTQGLSHQNTPSTTKIHQNDDLLLFDIDEENEIFQKECLHINHQEKLQNEIIRQYELGNEEIKATLKTIENEFQQQKNGNLPENSIERIRDLLEKVDHLDLYFPTIHQQISMDEISNSISLDHQPSPISVLHPHVHFRMK